VLLSRSERVSTSAQSRKEASGVHRRWCSSADPDHPVDHLSPLTLVTASSEAIDGGWGSPSIAGSFL
jgi:hypothetical protein